MFLAHPTKPEKVFVAHLAKPRKVLAAHLGKPEKVFVAHLTKPGKVFVAHLGKPVDDSGSSKPRAIDVTSEMIGCPNNLNGFYVINNMTDNYDIEVKAECLRPSLAVLVPWSRVITWLFVDG